MTKLSANLGLLWTELELLDAVRAAHRAGFVAVETHWPYITQPLDLSLVLEELKMTMVVLNTVAGDLAKGEFGVAALPGRNDEAESAVDKALAYALDVSAQNIHVLAGKIAPSESSTAIFTENLHYAARRAAEYGIGVLIEPLSNIDEYFLTNVGQAAKIINNIGTDHVKILFNCFHVANNGGNVSELLHEYLPLVGHVQIASVPDRSEPDRGEINYPELVAGLHAAGYDGFIGAGYEPLHSTDAGLGWMNDYLK